jgi:hypothetical protein
MEKEKKHLIPFKKNYQHDTFNFHMVNPKKIYHRKEKYSPDWEDDYPVLEGKADIKKSM